MIWQRAENWIGSEIDDSFVMVNIDSGNYVALNPTANAVWEALETPSSEDRLVEQLTAQFDVEADACRKSLQAALARMAELEMISGN